MTETAELDSGLLNYLVGYILPSLMSLQSLKDWKSGLKVALRMWHSRLGCDFAPKGASNPAFQAGLLARATVV